MKPVPPGPFPSARTLRASTVSCFRLLRSTFCALAGFSLQDPCWDLAWRWSWVVAPLVAQGPVPEPRIFWRSGILMPALPATAPGGASPIWRLISSRGPCPGIRSNCATRHHDAGEFAHRCGGFHSSRFGNAGRRHASRQAELEGFLARNPKSPFGLQASMDLAQVGGASWGSPDGPGADEWIPKCPGPGGKRQGSVAPKSRDPKDRAIVRFVWPRSNKGAGFGGNDPRTNPGSQHFWPSCKSPGPSFNWLACSMTRKRIAQRIEAIDVAFKSFDTLAALDTQSPICWKAPGLAAFCSRKKANPKRPGGERSFWRQRTQSPGQGGQSLGPYYLLRIIKEDPEPSERNQATKWCWMESGSGKPIHSNSFANRRG